MITKKRPDFARFGKTSELLSKKMKTLPVRRQALTLKHFRIASSNTHQRTKIFLEQLKKLEIGVRSKKLSHKEALAEAKRLYVIERDLMQDYLSLKALGKEMFLRFEPEPTSRPSVEKNWGSSRFGNNKHEVVVHYLFRDLVAVQDLFADVVSSINKLKKYEEYLEKYPRGKI
jgi:hypothetical protein